MKVLVLLPLILLAAGFLLGIAQLNRTLIFLVSWLTLCAAFYISSLMYGILYAEPIGWVGALTAVLLALPSMWFATLFGFATSQPSDPPIQRIYTAYRGLSKAQKRRVQGLAKTGLGVAARHGSTYLRNRGHTASADALDEMGRSLK